MKTLYIDCSMGAAGDMLTAALLELVPEKDAIIRKLNSLMPGVEISASRSEKCGIVGTHVSVKIDGKEEIARDVHIHSHEHSHDHVHPHTHDHEHEHGHTHEAGHSHRGMAEINEIVKGMDIPENVRANVLSVYNIVAEAESIAHGKDVSMIHFHEVGEKDAIMDITAVCLLMDAIKPDVVIASPVHVGSGYVNCAHGILPVPAPATAHILKDIPAYGGQVEGELCTPTGAALLKFFTSSFSDMPYMITKSIGYGMGTKDFKIANCIRAMLGDDGKAKPEEGQSTDRRVINVDSDISDEREELNTDTVLELSFNVDDMTAEEIAFATEKMYDAGAKEVFTMAVGMKKNRPGTLVKALCYIEDRKKLLECIFKHTSTIGIREAVINRYVLDRKEDMLETRYGKIRQKTSEGYGVKKTKIEYDDLSRAAKDSGKSISEVRRELEKLFAFEEKNLNE